MDPLILLSVIYGAATSLLHNLLDVFTVLRDRLLCHTCLVSYVRLLMHGRRGGGSYHLLVWSLVAVFLLVLRMAWSSASEGWVAFSLCMNCLRYWRVWMSDCICLFIRWLGWLVLLESCSCYLSVWCKTVLGVQLAVDSLWNVPWSSRLSLRCRDYLCLFYKRSWNLRPLTALWVSSMWSIS